MKKYIYLGILFLILEIHTINKFDTSVIKIYLDSNKFDKLGYNNSDFYKNGESLIIKHFIKAGDTIFDAGAHVGEWSNLILKHTKNHCNLYAFEPVPGFFKKLTKLVKSRASCFNLGLGRAESSAVMNYYAQAEVCSSLYERKVLANLQNKKINISITYLDKFCEDHRINHIDFLKIDTEGAEWDILQGADNLLTGKHIDIIQFEYGGTYLDAKITLLQVYTYLTSKNYTVFRITPNGLIHISAWRNELENFQYANYLACSNLVFNEI